MGGERMAITASGEAGVTQSGSGGGGSGKRFPVCADCERDVEETQQQQQQLCGEAVPQGGRPRAWGRHSAGGAGPRESELRNAAAGRLGLGVQRSPAGVFEPPHSPASEQGWRQGARTHGLYGSL